MLKKLLSLADLKEYKKADDTEPVAVKFSLSWTVIGLAGRNKLDPSLGVTWEILSMCLYVTSEQATEVSFFFPERGTKAWDVEETTNERSETIGEV